MQRGNKTFKKADAILTADWHLREDTPICRTDNFWETQWEKVEFVYDLQMKHDCPVLHAGDLFHHWKPSPYLLSTTIDLLPMMFWTVYGNHDLPQHSMNMAGKSGIYTLHTAGKIGLYPSGNWGEDITSSYKLEMVMKGNRIALWHKMVYQGQKPFPGCVDPMAAKILRQYPDFNLIVTGDNHKPFTEEYEGRLLVNPGSLTRQRSSETHQPRVYLYYANTNTVEPVYLPAPEDAVSREHIEVQEERDNRIDAFISRLDGEWEAGMSFEENLEKFKTTNNVRESVMEIIYKAIEND